MKLTDTGVPLSYEPGHSNTDNSATNHTKAKVREIEDQTQIAQHSGPLNNLAPRKNGAPPKRSLSETERFECIVNGNTTYLRGMRLPGDPSRMTSHFSETGKALTRTTWKRTPTEDCSNVVWMPVAEAGLQGGVQEHVVQVVFRDGRFISSDGSASADVFIPITPSSFQQDEQAVLPVRTMPVSNGTKIIAVGYNTDTTHPTCAMISRPGEALATNDMDVCIAVAITATKPGSSEAWLYHVHPANIEAPDDVEQLIREHTRQGYAVTVAARGGSSGNAESESMSERLEGVFRREGVPVAINEMCENRSWDPSSMEDHLTSTPLGVWLVPGEGPRFVDEFQEVP